jgi:hypothetical protein
MNKSLRAFMNLEVDHLPLMFFFDVMFLQYIFFLNAGRVLLRSNILKTWCTGNALERVQRVHEPLDVWDITFCTRRF